MTDNQFIYAWREAMTYTDRDAFVSDMALSSAFPAPEDGSIDQDLIDHLGSIWDAAHRSVRQIAADAGLSSRKLAEHFGIPYRTMENWCAGTNKCPDYARMMMQECVGLLNR